MKYYITNTLQTSNRNKFGNSWTAGGYGCAGAPKEPEDKVDENPCDAKTEKKAAKACAAIRDKKGKRN